MNSSRPGITPALVMIILFTVSAWWPPQRTSAVSAPLIPTAGIGTVQGVAIANGPITATVYVATHAGLYRSASATYAMWEKRNALHTIVAMSANPRHPDSLLYSGPAGIYRSTDGGRSGRLVAACARPIFARSLSMPSVVYATANYGISPAICKSTDDGLTWTTVLTTTTSGTSGDEGFAGLAVDPVNPAHVLVGESGFKGYGDVMETTNGGRTWHLLENAPYAYWSPYALAINPGNPWDVWIAWSGVSGPGGALRESTDGGHHWIQATAGVPRPPSVQTIVFDPVSLRVYIESYSGRSAPYVAASGPYDSADYERFEPFASLAMHRGDLWGLTTNGYAFFGNTNTPLTDNTGAPFSADKVVATGNWTVAARFATYDAAIGGPRLLGQPLSPETTCDGHLCQYFAKGRLDDSAGTAGRAERIAFGAVVTGLLRARVTVPVGGTTSSVTYKTLAGATQRIPPPAGFHGGIKVGSRGTFVPATPLLRAVPGYTVPHYFWQYMIAQPGAAGGWRHDVGVPLTRAVQANVTKGALGRRAIIVQAFQYAVLTYDPRNPAPFRVERANIGADYTTAFPDAGR